MRGKWLGMTEKCYLQGNEKGNSIQNRLLFSRINEGGYFSNCTSIGSIITIYLLY